MSRDLRERFLSRQLTVDQLGSLMREFLDVVRAQDGDSRGWPGTFYGVSKLGVTLLSSLQQKEFDRTPRNDILVNAGEWRASCLSVSVTCGPVDILNGSVSGHLRVSLSCVHSR